MAKAEPKTTTTPLKKYHYAYGRRKTAVATVRLFSGEGQSTVNDVAFDKLYPGKVEQVMASRPFSVAGLNPTDFHFTAMIKGSGSMGQLQALVHGLAKAIVVMDPDLKSPLKKQGMMTRDPRMVERKKPGLRKARKAEQYSKR